MTYANDGTFTDSPYCIETFSGRRVDPFNPNPALIVIDDIAHALARICRFNGHVADPVGHSVAAHSTRVAGLCFERSGRRPLVALHGLFHDATEAYLGDIVRPLRKRPEFAFYHEAESRLAEVIFTRFGLGWPMHPSVADADNDTLADELASRGATYFQSTISATSVANEFVGLAFHWGVRP